VHLIERTAAAVAVWRARQKRFKKKNKNPFISVSIARKGKEQSGRTEFLNLFFVFFFVFCFVLLFSSLDQHDYRCVTIGVQVVGNVKSIYLSLDGGQEEEEKVNRISPSFEYVSHLSNHRLSRSKWNKSRGREKSQIIEKENGPTPSKKSFPSPKRCE
jgi:hypothetical protein